MPKAKTIKIPSYSWVQKQSKPRYIIPDHSGLKTRSGRVFGLISNGVVKTTNNALPLAPVAEPFVLPLFKPADAVSISANFAIPHETKSNAKTKSKSKQPRVGVKQIQNEFSKIRPADIEKIDTRQSPRRFFVHEHAKTSKRGQWISEQHLPFRKVDKIINLHAEIIPKDIYDSSADPAMKKTCNELFVKSCQLDSNKTLSETNPVLILDTCKFTTTKMLIASGIPAKWIHLPNPTILSGQKPKNIVLHNCSVGTYLDKTCMTFGAVWLDYCCTLSGNALCSPINDIENLFSGKRFSKQSSVFAITLCQRFKVPTHTPWSVPNEDEREQNYNHNEALRVIQKKGLEHGYSVVFETQRLYFTMLFLLFTIRPLTL